MIRDIKYEEYNNSIHRTALIIGYHQGGGALIGIDAELLLGKRFGIQTGGGYMAFGTGLNIHLKPTINSSFISLQYWHQRFDKAYSHNIIGPNIVFRGNKWITAQLGIGFPTKLSSAFQDRYSQFFVVTYAVGIYFCK